MNIEITSKLTGAIKSCFALSVLFGCYAHSAHAYMAKGYSDSCTAYYDSRSTNGVSINTSYVLDGTILSNLQSGQYYAIPGATKVAMNMNAYTSTFKLSCTNLGPDQTAIGLSSVSGNSSYVKLVSESQIIDGAGIKKASDTNDKVGVIQTSYPGVFLALSTAEGYVPNNENMSTVPSSYVYTLSFNVLLSRDFVPSPNKITATQVGGYLGTTLSDSQDATISGTHGTATISVDSLRFSGVIDKLSTCDYSLSNGGNVDFGDLNADDITTDNTTTVKKTLTLNLSNCSGVNKVKTSISTGKPTLASGVILKNGLTGTSAATNIGVSLNVSNNGGTENAGSVIKMDGSNSLEWTIEQGSGSTGGSKSIPLDVLMLRTNDEPTSGQYEATASIMIDFI